MSKIEIPADVLEEILARLSVKSLLRFACVSQSWCSLYRNRTFISKQLLNGPSGSDHAILNLDLFRFRERLSQKLSLIESVGRVVNLDNTKHRCNIVGQCDGLICYALREPKNSLLIPVMERDPMADLAIHLWNPTIGQVKILPEPDILLPRPRRTIRIGLGFGHDPKSGDFKVVRFVDGGPKLPRIEAEVYSLRTNSWRSVACSLTGRPRFKSVGVCLGGFCYWAGYTLSNGCRDAPMIISYDLSNEVFRQYLVLELVNTCPYRRHGFMEPRLFVWKGSLTLVMFPSTILSPFKGRFIDIWSFESGVDGPLTLKEHIDRDQKEHLDDTDMVTKALNDVEFLFDDDLILTEREDRIVSRSTRIGKKERTTLKAFNISTRKMRDIFSVEMGSYWFTLQIVGYTPSLVSLLKPEVDS